MKLSFECKLDPKEIPTKQGKKFCQNCQKQVYDLRRKSDEKIARFYKEHPTACVIAYGDQLDRLPTLHPENQRINCFPYAAAVITIALLPSLTIAQTQVQMEKQPVSSMPVVIPDMASTAVENNKEVNTKKTNGPYYIAGKLKIRDKKFKTKKGRNITIYMNNYSADGNYLGRDTLASGKSGLNGKFRFKISDRHFNSIQQSSGHVEISIQGLSRVHFKDITFKKNVIQGIASASSRIRWMGKF
ncbi:MAG: hypothetical protein K0S33_1183 [Bacteroidetes bacterium]|jgi:hypothetical protein|nr:hypothetical protein [Bacteroidota bacterium]